MKTINKNSRGQIWGLDLIAGVTLFTLGIVIFFVYSMNQPGEAQENFEPLLYEGKVVANNLMSEGYPSNWNSNNIITAGITSDNKINETKLEELYNMIYIDGNYTRTQNLLDTQYDYYFSMSENMTIDGNQVEGIGKPGITVETINSKNLVKITRFTIYQNKTMPLYVYIWEE